MPLTLRLRNDPETPTGKQLDLGEIEKKAAEETAVKEPAPSEPGSWLKPVLLTTGSLAVLLLIGYFAINWYRSSMLDEPAPTAVSPKEVRRTPVQKPPLYSAATEFQRSKLAGTHFSTGPLLMVNGQLCVARRMLLGENFERLAADYCSSAGIGAEGCAGTMVFARKYHSQVHWHKGWEEGDIACFPVPDSVFK